MLSAKDIRALAATHNIQVRNYWSSTSEGDALPELQKVHLWFQKEEPEAWKTLVTNLTEVPVHISGTRMVTSSGATDNMLYPSYRELLPEVNAKRAEIGLSPILN